MYTGNKRINFADGGLTSVDKKKNLEKKKKKDGTRVVGGGRWRLVFLSLLAADQNRVSRSRAAWEFGVRDLV